MNLNLGCGSKILEGYTNVDKYDYYNCDIVHDLEKFPYPFENNSIDKILLSHVLEHIGQDPNIFNKIIVEFYRICKPEALIEIIVPHPRHDDFISDPTHVRPITVLGLSQFDKEQNEVWASAGAANTPLALILDVNFKIENAQHQVDDYFKKKVQSKELTYSEVENLSKYQNNIIKQTVIIWRVKKDKEK